MIRTAAMSTSSTGAGATWRRFCGATASACALRQTARPGKVHLAVGEGGRRVDLGRTDGLHARRDRLAESATDVAAQSAG